MTISGSQTVAQPYDDQVVYYQTNYQITTTKDYPVL